MRIRVSTTYLLFIGIELFFCESIFNGRFCVNLRKLPALTYIFILLQLLLIVFAFTLRYTGEANETPVLPDFTKEPYIFLTKGKAIPLANPQYGFLPAKIYDNTTSGEAIAVFEHDGGVYIEWLQIEAIDEHGNHEKVTVYAFRWDKAKKLFLFEGKKSFKWMRSI